MDSNRYIHTLKEIIDYQPSKVIRVGNFILFLVLFLLLLLSYLIKLPTTIEARAILTSDPPPERVYSNSTNKIDKVFVLNNSFINENTPIILFENSANYRDILFLKSTIANFDIYTDTLSFPINNMPFLMLGDVQEFYSSFERLYLDYLHTSKFNTSRIVRESNINNIDIFKERLKTLKQGLNLEFRKQSILLKDKNRSKSLINNGIISQREYEKYSLREFEGRQEIQRLKVEISKLTNEIENSYKDVEINTANLEISSQAVYKSLIHSFNRLKVEINNWEKNYLVKSSSSGIFTFNKYFNKNEVIDTKTLIGSTITNDKTKPVIQIHAPIDNSGKLKLGQQVNIKFDNYDYIEYGIVYACITQISNVVDQNQQYLIKAELSNGLVTSYGEKLPFKNDITASVSIIIDESSILERIFLQFKSLFRNT